MLAYNEIKPKRIIDLGGEPYQVLSAHVSRKQQRKPVNQTKLKHLITGNVIEHTFQQSENVEEAEIETRAIKYLYTNRGQWWFADPDDPSDRFQIDESVIGDTHLFLKENDVVSAIRFNDTIVGITLPSVKMHFTVTEAPPNIKGNTASGGTKPVTIETGAVINTPMFVKIGDTIEVNTETGDYVRRVD